MDGAFPPRGKPSDQSRLLRVIAFQADLTDAGRDPEHTIRLACARARAITQADGAAVEVSAAGELIKRAADGSLAATPGAPSKIAAVLLRVALRAGEALNCADSEHDPRVDREACRQAGLRSMLCVPLINEGVTAGVLKVVSPALSAFDETDVAVLRLLGAVIAVAMTQGALEAQLRDPATHDPLTGLPNRRRWDEELDSALALARRDGGKVSVCLLDIDGFTAFNAEQGRGAGDRLLCDLAAGWQRVTRSNELLGRLGGDEFALLLRHRRLIATASILERLSNALPPGCTVAIGLATARNGDGPASLMRRADEAIRAARAARPRRVA
jgi:diguanylate cyclase (GGDEF)-like protein